VHDLHLWSLTADLPAASVHLAVNPETDKEQVTTFILALFVTNLICFACLSGQHRFRSPE
jgi:Co/Zn/Cd efflux system component